ncbi:hypothetical protein INT45_010854 [Circinella minor]|uniref:Uncharacterized protein n=1 Tax=Circinella minor TaxID=1195481 RepID=A0A8H7S8Q3_9FUNG|nr:hypothetical protein INT45_010854 [Circinella minor]
MQEYAFKYNTLSEASAWVHSSADDDSSDSDEDSDEDKPSKKRRRKSNNNNNKKNKGKGPAINKKNGCPLNPKANLHHRWECDKLKEVLGSARNNNNNNNFVFGNRHNSNCGFPGNSTVPSNAAKMN